MKDYKYIPVLTMDAEGRLLNEKQLRALAKHLNDPNVQQKKRKKADKKLLSRISE